MKRLWLTLNWMFGILFLLNGIVRLFDNPKISIPLILISLILLPPIRDFVYLKTHKELSFKIRTTFIVVLLSIIASGMFIDLIQDRKALDLEAKKEQEQAQIIAKIKDENIKYFKENSTKILSDVESAIDIKDYQKAISLSSKYLPANNLELLKLHKTANTAKILNELKTTPEYEIEIKKNLYQQLISIHPDNEQYKSSLTHYEKKIAEWKERERIAAERAKEIQRKVAEQQKSSTSTDYEHDLTERCKDWIYNRNRAYKLSKEGNQKGAEQARIAMLTFDRDLRKYFTEKQISDEIARLEASGYKVGF